MNMKKIPIIGAIPPLNKTILQTPYGLDQGGAAVLLPDFAMNL